MHSQLVNLPNILTNRKCLPWSWVIAKVLAQNVNLTSKKRSVLFGNFNKRSTWGLGVEEGTWNVLNSPHENTKHNSVNMKNWSTGHVYLPCTQLASRHFFVCFFFWMNCLNFCKLFKLVGNSDRSIAKYPTDRTILVTERETSKDSDLLFHT